jgi:hypothetical protein
MLRLDPASALDASSQLASWNDGPARRAVIDFVSATTDETSKTFVPLAERVATFDQDGTLWVEHPMYTFMTYCFERVPMLVKEKPDLKEVEPFKTVLSGNLENIDRLTVPDLEKILSATLTGMTVDEFKVEVTNWLKTARHPRWNRPYTDLFYQPMLEVIHLLRVNGYRTYIVTGVDRTLLAWAPERCTACRRSTWSVRHPTQGSFNWRLTQEPRLCHRPVRQESRWGSK